MTRPKVAIGLDLLGCPQVITLGMKPNFEDYTPEEQRLIYEAETIYFPTFFYVGLFKTLGKRIFPSYECYEYAGNKIKQTALFKLLEIPHPYTRIFYGSRQKAKILHYFSFPFIAKIARGSSKGEGVFLIRNQQELEAYNQRTHVAYIQEYLPIEKDLRVIVVKDKVILAYWKVKKVDEFRCNVAQGAAIDFDNIPSEAVNLALEVSRKCHFDNVGIDICFYKGRYYVLEVNMKYGHTALRLAGIDYKKMLAEMITKGEI